MISDRWPAEWLRGVLSVSVLAIIAEGDTYGYAIAQRLDEAGLGRIKGGTLYPLLGRHEENGLIASRWQQGDGGPGRKVFSLTAGGRRAARAAPRGLGRLHRDHGRADRRARHDDVGGDPTG